MSEPASRAELRDAPSIGGGRFALVAKIAEGGMAGVYRAWDSELEVWRAVKVLLPEYANREAVRERFEREASAMALLEHPNVVRVYDVVCDESLPYIVMEISEGGSLIRWLEAYGAMPPALACKVTLQVARGLGAAHAAGIVHRDVKPHNVLVSTDGTCKVTDFGIARIRIDRPDEEITRTGATMGTIGYMAPEQRSSAKDVDQRADVYSLGALVYKLITGNILTDLFLVAHEPELLDAVPTPLHDLIIRATYHDRERRFPGTTEFSKALSDIQVLLEDDPADTPPLTIPVMERQLDPSAADPFPEIRPLLSPDAEPPPPLGYPDPVPPQPTQPLLQRAGSAPLAPDNTDDSPVLPYRMPEFHPSLATPAYAIDGLPTVPLTPPEVEPTSITPPTPAPRPLPPAPPEGPEWWSVTPATRWLAAAALAAWSLLIAMGVWGALSVRGAAQQALSAQHALYRALDHEQMVFAQLKRQGLSVIDLEELRERREALDNARQEPARWGAAVEFVVALHGKAQSRAAGERADRLYATYVDAYEARVEWYDTANTATGRLAVGLGLAPPPQ